MRLFLIFILFFTIIIHGYSQQDTIPIRRKIYRVNPWVTIPIIAVATVTNYYGILFLKSKPGIDESEIPNLGPEDVNAFDRGATRQHTYYTTAKKDMKASDIIMSTVTVFPMLLGFDKSIRKDGVKMALMYLETMVVMANAYSWGVGHINRKRPYVFNPNEDPNRRTRSGSFNSFYGGHAATAAASTFFICKVYSDYHPDSKLRPYLYGAALVPPIVVAYFRYKSGMHFPTDLAAGIVGGAFLGTIIPHIHKINYKKDKNKNLSLNPIVGPYNGLSMTYQF